MTNKIFEIEKRKAAATLLQHAKEPFLERSAQDSGGAKSGRRAKEPISECEMGSFMLRYGAFRPSIKPISQPEMGSFASYCDLFRCVGKCKRLTDRLLANRLKTRVFAAAKSLVRSAGTPEDLTFCQCEYLFINMYIYATAYSACVAWLSSEGSESAIWCAAGG